MSKPEFKVNGHRCSYISSPNLNGRYHLHLDREWPENTIEAIEQVDWSKITVEKARDDAMRCWLPDGYTFRLEDISYLNGDKTYVVSVRTDKQSYGDVTPYQAQIESLNATVTEQTAQIADKDAQLEEKDVQLEEKDAQLAEKDSEIAAMADAETAAKILLGEVE